MVGMMVASAQLPPGLLDARSDCSAVAILWRFIELGSLCTLHLLRIFDK